MDEYLDREGDGLRLRGRRDNREVDRPVFRWVCTGTGGTFVLFVAAHVGKVHVDQQTDGSGRQCLSDGMRTMRLLSLYIFHNRRERLRTTWL